MEPESNSPSAPNEIDSGTPVRQISVFLPNRVGALLSIVKLLQDRSIAVLGISVQDSVDVTLVRLVTSDPDSVAAVFMERGIAYASADLLVAELKEGAEGLPSCLEVLLEAETNIHFIYPLLNRPNGRAAIALYLEDNFFGRSVLVRNAIKILCQEDLSR